MLRKVIAVLIAASLVFTLAACGTSSDGESSGSAGSAASSEASSGSAEGSEGSSGTSVAGMASVMGTVANDLAVDEQALIDNYAGKFEQKTYEDSESGLSITYNLYLPEGYDESKEYPMVVFIADSSCAQGDAETSLTQGRGALVWASDEWQSENPAIVAVPTYPETILDDHGSYTTTEYVELTKRFIESMSSEYAVDTDRIYGTGQSMGCMTTLILAAEYPDLYAACMFVDGQWDISALEGLEDQKFVYFAAEDDENAWAGAQEVMEMFDSDSVSYAKEQWDGTWSVDELSEAAEKLFTDDEDQYFISWKTGTIEASDSGMGGGSVAYHMASFDYAYNCVAVMEWLFSQSKQQQ